MEKLDPSRCQEELNRVTRQRDILAETLEVLKLWVPNSKAELLIDTVLATLDQEPKP